MGYIIAVTCIVIGVSSILTDMNRSDTLGNTDGAILEILIYHSSYIIDVMISIVCWIACAGVMLDGLYPSPILFAFKSTTGCKQCQSDSFTQLTMAASQHLNVKYCNS